MLLKLPPIVTKSLIYGGGFIILSLIILFLWLIIISPGTTAPIKDAKGKILKGSISEAYDHSIGGLKQFLTIRGKSTDNPVLLFLHGGPGDAEGHLLRHYNKELEDHFIVVNWDQRGSGRTFSKDNPEDKMNLSQFIADGEELTTHLKEKFNKDKIILLGHSWGAFLGMQLVHKNPDDYHAFAAIGLPADQVRGEEYSYYKLLEMAKEKKDKKSVNILSGFGAPVNGKYGDDFKGTIAQRQIMMEYGHTAYGRDKWALFSMLMKPLLGAREYKISHKLNWMKGGAYSGPRLFDELFKSPLIEDIPELKIPFYLFQGKHDLNTPYIIAKEYFDAMSAPHKEMFTFEKSAHFLPFNQEKEKFNRFMVEKVRKEAMSSSNAQSVSNQGIKLKSFK